MNVSYAMWSLGCICWSSATQCILILLAPALGMILLALAAWMMLLAPASNLHLAFVRNNFYLFKSIYFAICCVQMSSELIRFPVKTHTFAIFTPIQSIDLNYPHLMLNLFRHCLIWGLAKVYYTIQSLGCICCSHATKLVLFLLALAFVITSTVDHFASSSVAFEMIFPPAHNLFAKITCILSK